MPKTQYTTFYRQGANGSATGCTWGGYILRCESDSTNGIPETEEEFERQVNSGETLILKQYDIN